MRNKVKKLLSLLLATVCVGTTLAFTACKDDSYKGDVVTDYVSNAEVRSNGGFAVEKGDFIYFINGKESYSANNAYGEVTKGALMRISKTDLAEGKTNSLKTIVPSLFVAQDYTSGIYIYGDYVYYATPTTDKDIGDGSIAYTHIDFKRAKLDGSEAPSDYFFRLSNNSAKYRFVEVAGKVYCVYEETVTKNTGNSALQLKSYNVSTGETTVLVEGATSFYYDNENLENPYVYYTMKVTVDIDSENATSVSDYNQLYRVNAANTAVTDANSAKYTVYNGNTLIKEYDFDETYLSEQNEKAEKGKEPYTLSDYSTYPYVNLGELVLDGIGQISTKTQFNWDVSDQAKPQEHSGYTYSIKAYQDGDLYFTRTAKPGNLPSQKLYCLANGDIDGEWNSVTGNDEENFDVVAMNTTNTASAIFTKVETGNKDEQYYFYVNEEKTVLYRAGYDNKANVKLDEVQLIRLTETGDTITLWKVEGDYLYYFSGSGNNLSRVKWAGTAQEYNYVTPSSSNGYAPVEIPAVNCNLDWYKPEIIDDVLLYSGAQKFGSSSLSYNYIYTANMANATIKASELYTSVQEDIDDTTNVILKNLKTHYYRTGSVHDLYTAQKDDYTKSVTKGFDEFVAKFAEGKEFAFATENHFITLLSKMTSDDATAVGEAWESYLTLASDEVTETDDAFPTWAIWLIVCGSVAIVATAVIIALVILHKKKVAKRKEAEATVNAYKRKRVDTTDDKTIDVYATDEEIVDESPAQTDAETDETADETADETTDETADDNVQEKTE